MAALRQRGISCRGVIYAGLMLTPSGIQVIEFNCRFGDPECQTLMPLLEGDLAGVFLACAEGRLESAPPLTIRPQCCACVVAAAAIYPGEPKLGDLINDAGPGPQAQTIPLAMAMTNWSPVAAGCWRLISMPPLQLPMGA